MKSIYFVILLAFSITSTPQVKAQYAIPPDLIVIKSKLDSIVRVDITRPDPPPYDNQYSYLKELREQLKNGLLRGRAEIKRIDYADGRIWLPLKLKSQ